MLPDPREKIYENLHQRQLSEQEQQNHHSATRILSILRQYFDFHSIVDVGCGLGTWLRAAHDIGISDLRGIEGPWLKETEIVIPREIILQYDLEKAFTLDRRFDLAICLEVGEHLSPGTAGNLVESLINHASHILFSAAVPFQGGHHHANEQFLPYWADLFSTRDYIVVDLLRTQVWNDPSILWWLRQNTVLFVHKSTLESNPKLLSESRIPRPLSIIHPHVYSFHLEEAFRVMNEYKKFARHLLQYGGNVRISKTPNGRLAIEHLDKKPTDTNPTTNPPPTP